MMVTNLVLAILAITCLHPSCAVMPPDEELEVCDAKDSCPERKSLLQQSSRQHDPSHASLRTKAMHQVALNHNEISRKRRGDRKVWAEQRETGDREACPLDISGMKDAKGLVEPLTAAGFAAVRACCCPAQMREFVRRLVESRSDMVCDEGGLNGLVLYFYCDEYLDNDFSTLETELFGPGRPARSGDCPWITAASMNCPAHDPIKCPGFTGGTVPPCIGCATTTTTTTTATTPTTTTTTTTSTTTTTTTADTIVGPTTTTTTTSVSGTCAGASKDIFLAIDASNSVKDNGWIAEQDFAADLAEAIAAGGNPNGHRINAHWFADVTSPTCVAAGSNWCVAPGSVAPGNQHSRIYEPNNVGIFSTDAAQIESDIRALVYSVIKAGSTDHPQVLLTAQAAFSQANLQNKMIVLITDGETHKGEDCPSLAVAEALVGTCQTGHPCGHNCADHKCMCGLYKATKFKQDHPDITLAIVAITNGNKGAMFEDQMTAMASPNQLYYAENGFSDLPGILSQLVAGLCQ